MSIENPTPRQEGEGTDADACDVDPDLVELHQILEWNAALVADQIERGGV